MSYLKGKTVLITAGPTREYIDPVRYISNDSSGLMGFSLADEASKSGAEVILISGPVNLSSLPKIKKISVVSAAEMFSVVKKFYKKADIIICAAAVADWRPKRYSKNKIKKSPVDKLLRLTPNPDILRWLGLRTSSGQTLVGFALETENHVGNAQKKLKKKNCDLIIANDASTIGKKDTSLAVIDRRGKILRIAISSKQAVAKTILKLTVQNS